MAIIVPAGNQPIPGGTVQPPNLIYSGTVNTGDVVTIDLDNSVRDAGVTRSDYDLYIMSAPSPPWSILRGISPSYGTPAHLSWTADGPKPFYLVLMGGGAPLDSSHGTAINYRADLTRASLTLCAYGTQLRSGVQLAYYITPALLDLWLDSIGMPWLARALVGIYYSTLDVSQLCASGPPPLPTIDLSTLGASAETILQIVHAVAWPNLCECKPGTPAPIPFPPPSATQPPGWPAVPTFPCSNVDPCAALVEIQKQLAALSSTLKSNYELTTLLQRYGLPFEYILGAVHNNLSGAGSFAVSRVAGVKVTVLEHPASNQTFSGEPPYISDLGWISLATPDGMIDEVRLTRTNQTWVSRLFPLADMFGYSCREGVRISVQELYAEP